MLQSEGTNWGQAFQICGKMVHGLRDTAHA